MIQGIDHLVIAVVDLEAAQRRWAERGFTVVAGGRHGPAWGTENALIAFADGAYLELIAFYRPNPQHRWWEPLQRGGGLIDFCLRTDDLEGDAAAFRAAGVEMGEPQERSRTRPDGYEVRWVFTLAHGVQRGVAPFLIRDETPRAERVPAATAHPNGATGVASLSVAVEDLPRARGWYARALGQAGEDVRRPELGATGVSFRIGPQRLELLEAADARGTLARWLSTRGRGPYEATLSTPHGPRRLDLP